MFFFLLLVVIDLKRRFLNFSTNRGHDFDLEKEFFFLYFIFLIFDLMIDIFDSFICLCILNSVDGCPENKALYLQTGDLSSLPLLCHYPVKVYIYINIIYITSFLTFRKSKINIYILFLAIGRQFI